LVRDLMIQDRIILRNARGGDFYNRVILNGVKDLVKARGKLCFVV
jgi:hypothetical protein